MKKLKMFLFCWGALSLAAVVFAGGKQVTQKYEVVCMKCMAHNAAMGKKGGHGAGHAACAMSCASKGTDLGLLDAKGNLYEVVNSDFESARDSLKDKAGQTVELTGEVVKTKGVNYLKLADSGSDQPKEGEKDKD